MRSEQYWKSARRRPVASWPSPCLSQSQITFVTFDVYGTLIDWEAGAFACVQQGGYP